MTIAIQPIPGHPFLIEATEAIRSPEDFLGRTIKASNAESSPVLLTHPPVLLVQEGGGEMALNPDAVSAQLNYRKVPSQLRAFIINNETESEDQPLLYSFIFGPIQRMHYQKKGASGKILWKQAMQNIEGDPHLKSIIENTLFNGEKLEPRHYMVLLSAARIGESSINHELGEIRGTDQVKSVRCKANDSPSNFSDNSNGAFDNSSKKDQSRLPSKATKRSFDLGKSISNIRQAAERGQKQFTLGIEEEVG